MRVKLKAFLALGLALGLSGEARAAAASDSLTVTITPNAFYAVDIDTASVNLNLGTVDLSATTQTVKPATVTIQSTYATTDLKLQGAVLTAVNPWAFDADSTTVETDNLASWATFTTVARSSAPPQSTGYFSGTAPGVSDSDMISTTNRDVGTAGAFTGLFEAASGDFAFKDMDALPPDPDALAKAHLWLYFRMPGASTGNGAQSIQLTLTAGAIVP